MIQRNGASSVPEIPPKRTLRQGRRLDRSLARQRIHFYGLVLGNEGKKFGNFTLRELEDLKFPPFGLGIERDMYFSNKTIKDVI